MDTEEYYPSREERDPRRRKRLSDEMPAYNERPRSRYVFVRDLKLKVSGDKDNTFSGARRGAVGEIEAGAALEAETDIIAVVTRMSGRRRVRPSSRNCLTAPRQIPASLVTRLSSSPASGQGIRLPLEDPEPVMGARPLATLPCLPRVLGILVTIPLQQRVTIRDTRLLTPETQVELSLCASSSIVFILIMWETRGSLG